MGTRNRAALSANRVRLRTARIMRAERSARAAFPAMFIMLAYLALALFGWGGPVWFAICALTACAALGFGLSRCRWPTPAEIDRRIETASGLRHRPFATLDDRQESPDPQTQAIWHLHRQRAGQATASARAGWPDPASATRDPWALRAVLLLLLVAGAVVAGPDAPSRLAGAFRLPALPPFGPHIDVWITPPDYAGAAPSLLAAGQTVTALPGSRIAVLVNGPRRLPALSFNGATLAGTALGPTSHRADGVLTRSARLLIGPWWRRLGAWTITIVPPAAPRLRLLTLGLTPSGQLRLAWDAEDDYGLTNLSARITPVAAPPDALVQSFALPAQPGTAATSLDLADDPLAGLPSRLVLTARNLAGAGTQLAPARIFTPPPPLLADPTAIALFGVRRGLALAPQNTSAAATGLRRIAIAPPSAIAGGVDVQLAALATALAAHQAGPREVVLRLGQLIRQIEAGPDYLPAQALARADRALLGALRRGLHGAPASAATLGALLQAMHDALAQHLAALGSASGSGQPVSLDALDRLARQIAADEAAGRNGQAARETAALQSALNALQTARPLTPAQAAQAQAAAAAARDLANLLGGEAALRDQTGRGTATPDQQAALQAALGAAQARLASAGIPLPGLNAAAGAMAGAHRALAAPDAAAAEAEEATAIENLQKAAAALNAAAQSLAIGPAGSQSGGVPVEGGDGANGAPDEQPDGFTLPGGGPADAIQQQILREDAAPDLPAPTHDYLHRLLDPNPK